MSPWTSVKDLKTRLEKEWDRGRLLATSMTVERPFPLRVPLRHPSSRELVEQYSLVKDWIEDLVRHSRSVKGKGYELEWREVNHRQIGKNRLPVAALFDQETDALAFIGRQREANSFRGFCEAVLGSFPVLRPWLEKKPLEALKHAPQWPKIEAVLQWLQAHPRPNIYIRQMELAGVDTKFIEQHKRLLGVLLELVLPSTGVDECARGEACFEDRYGFLSKPLQIRFRLLDSSLYFHGLSDLQIPAHDFSRLHLDVQKVFITENDINGLAFPDVTKAMVIFGLGYGFDRLAKSDWLHDKEIYYWGDIDTHGFAMLDQFRGLFPQTDSFLMDEATLMDHRPLWGQEQSPTGRELKRLKAPEERLYEDLRRNRFAEALRLEQERVSYTHLKAALAAWMC
jgi:hypothetical protein